MQKRDIQEKDFPQKDSLEKKISFLLQYAVIAPSTHNTQPWFFHIEGNECHIHLNPARVLEKADPNQKYLFISLGACIENLVLAAKHYGVFKSLKTFPQGKGGSHVATVVFSDEGEKEDFQYLIEAMLVRRNARGFFEQKVLTDEETDKKINQLKEMGYGKDVDVSFVVEKEKIEKVARATADGLEKTYKDKDFRKEMSGWMHSSLTQKKEGMPGYALRVPFLFSFILPTLVRIKDIGAKLGHLNFISIRTAPTVAMFSTKNPGPETWLEMGRLFERYVLENIGSGIFPSVFVASIEAETLPYTDLGLDHNPEFLFVVGRPEQLAPLTPRFSVEEKLK